MRIVWRCLVEHRNLWWLWLPLLLLSIILPLIVLMVPLVERTLIDQVILARRADLLPSTLLMYGALWLLSTIGQVLGSILRTALSEQFMVCLRERLFTQCVRLSVAYTQDEHSGRTIALFTSDVPSVAGLFSSATLAIVSSVVSVIAGGC